MKPTQYAPAHALLCIILAALTAPSTAALKSTESNKSEESLQDASGQQESVEGCGVPPWRLPTRLVPVHYDLVLMVDLESSSFEGAVQISLRVEDSLGGPVETGQRSEQKPLKLEDVGPQPNQIVLHADEALTIEQVWYLDLGSPDLAHQKNGSTSRGQKGAGRYIEVLEVCREPDYQLLVLTLAKDLAHWSEGQLHLTFSSPFSESMRGLYKRSLRDSAASGGERYYAATQLQATDARRVFPCFDEPALKSTFDLTLIHPAGRSSLSNMEPIHERLVGPDRSARLVRFGRTPPMSTYLLAFVVGDFEHMERQLTLTRNRELRVRVHAPPGRREQAKFALEVACRAVRLLEHYLGVELPLSKLDLAGVQDFQQGGMENWGLILFKQTMLLVDESNTAPEAKALIAGTVVHELAHQWFGNLVTMRWWRDLWLNEGFATWLEYQMTGELYPELDFQYNYLIESHVHALNEDSFRWVHAVRPDVEAVNDTQEIEDLFDSISYNKAAAIIRMLHDQYLGPDTFREAIRDYLWEHRFNSTDAEDLWRAFERRSHLPVGQFLSSWLNQPGHPMLTARLVEKLQPTLSLRQERLLSGVSGLTKEEKAQRWQVPISLLIGGKAQPELLEFRLDERRREIPLPQWFNATPGSGHWLKLNANFSGFYRVLYSEQLLRLLREPLERRLLSAADRLSLLDELNSLAAANRLSSATLLDTLTWFSNEDNGPVLEALLLAYSALFRNFEHQERLEAKLSLFGRRLFGNIYRKWAEAHRQEKWAEWRHSDMIGWSALLTTLVQLDYEPAVQRALGQFESESPLAPFLRRAVYMAVARHGSETSYERLYALFNGTQSREERSRLAVALARSAEPARLERAWLWLSSLAEGQLDDRLDVLHAMLADPAGRRFVRQLFELHSDQLLAVSDGKPLTNLVEDLCISSGPHSFSEMSHLFSRHKTVTDWRSSRDYIKRLFDWQSVIQNVSSALLESALDDYLYQVGAATATVTTTKATTTTT